MPNAEYEPIEINPTRRYFSEVHNVGHSYVSMCIAAETYIKAAGLPLNDQEIAGAIDSLPFPRGVEWQDQDVRDVFTVMPLIIVAPYIETTKTLRDIRKWYDETLPYIWARAGKHHTTDCLNSPGVAFSNQCTHSTVCPLIFTAKYLEKQMFDEDFTLPPYQDDVLLASEVAIMKEEMAVKYRLRKPDNSQKLIDLYRQRIADSQKEYS